MTESVESALAGEVVRGGYRNVILLGASNVTISFPVIVEQLRARHETARLFAAMGHGRSFGLWTRIFHRSLPGITNCSLWEDAANQIGQGESTGALVTDVGNDLMYAVPPGRIADWVELCLQRLAELRADVLMTLLPMGSVRRLTNAHYVFARTMLFPKCRIGWTDMKARAVELNERLESLAAHYGARTFEPPGEWYGLDPIHVRRPLRPAAWGRILSEWPQSNGEGRPVPFPRSTRSQLGRLRPALRRVFGREQITPQPVFSADGLSVSLY